MIDATSPEVALCVLMCSMSKLHEVYLAFGANLGDRAATMRAAHHRLATSIDFVQCSPLYETPPWGDLDQPPFLNAVCHAYTVLAPHDLLALLKQTERDLGRVAARHWGPRAIDLDILFYDDLVLDTPSLTLPHPRLHERAFVLVPLLTIAPQLRHPVLHKNIAELAADIDDRGVNIVAQAWA